MTTVVTGLSPLLEVTKGICVTEGSAGLQLNPCGAEPLKESYLLFEATIFTFYSDLQTS